MRMRDCNTLTDWRTGTSGSDSERPTTVALLRASDTAPRRSLDCHHDILCGMLDTLGAALVPSLMGIQGSAWTIHSLRT